MSNIFWNDNSGLLGSLRGCGDCGEVLVASILEPKGGEKPMDRMTRASPLRLATMLVLAALVGLCASAAYAANVYVDYNVYDNTSVDGYYYYSYEIFADATMTQNLSQWWLEIGGCPDATEVSGSPLPDDSGLPNPGGWGDSSGYTQGYSWDDMAIDGDLVSPGPAYRAVNWQVYQLAPNEDKDSDGTNEAMEPGTDNDSLSGWSLSIPSSPDTVGNTDVAIGWFQFKSTRPPMDRDYAIQDGVLQWTGTVKGPTPEPITMALLALGLPLGLLARRRKED